MQPRAQALGKRNKNTSPEGAKELIPDIPLVVRDIVFLQERHEFFLE